jgi:hypothetical protein
MAGGIVRAFIEDGDRPFVLLDKAEQDLQGRGLTGPIGADDAEDLASIDLKGEIVKGCTSRLKKVPSVGLRNLG